MAPDGKTLLVMEFFCSTGDSVWNESDKELAGITITGLEQLGFIKKNEVIDSCVVRAPKAYPLFEVGYAERCTTIHSYLSTFKNLHLAGRGGMFRYYNMDHAIESGLQAAERIIKTEVRSQKPEVKSGK